MADYADLLAAATTVGLWDWKGAEVPAALNRAGLTIVGHEPDGPKSYTVAAAAPDTPGLRTFPLKDGCVLVTSPLAAFPARIDLASTYRPPDEQLAILEDALAHGARAFFIEPGAGGVSPQTRARAEAAGIPIIDDISIAEAVKPR